MISSARDVTFTDKEIHIGSDNTERQATLQQWRAAARAVLARCCGVLSSAIGQYRDAITAVYAAGLNAESRTRAR